VDQPVVRKGKKTWKGDWNNWKMKKGKQSLGRRPLCGKEAIE
jgi:hypothetical protein